MEMSSYIHLAIALAFVAINFLGAIFSARRFFTDYSLRLSETFAGDAAERFITTKKRSGIFTARVWLSIEYLSVIFGFGFYCLKALLKEFVMGGPHSSHEEIDAAFRRFM